MRRFAATAILGWALCLLAGAGHAQQALAVKPLAERKVAQLPDGALYWRIENVESLAAANALAGPHALVAQAAGKVWLFTLGAPGGASAGALKVADVGPVPRIQAAEYLLRINEASGPPGSTTSVHTHPGSEAFFVLSGEQSIRTAQGVLRVASGQAQPGHGGDTPMQVSSSGTSDLHALVLFLVDASRPFSTPASLP